MFLQYLQDDPQYFMTVIITVIVSITIHELAHGAAAIALGDRTPIEEGHMTPNPLVHMGFFSIIMLVVAGISWGAMPVNPSRLRGKYGSAIVAVAGPMSNLLLALIAVAGVGFFLRHTHTPFSSLALEQQNLIEFFWVFGQKNVALALFNLIPVPPLDGYRILANFSRPYDDMMERLVSTGAYLIAFIAVFSAAGSFITPAAESIALRLLDLVTG